MANELIIKNGLIVDSGGVQVTGSTTSTQGFIKPGASNQYLLADGTTTNGTVAPPFPYTGSALISGSLTITGSLDVTQGITGSLLGTASWASNVISSSYSNNSTSASYALTASYALNAGGTTVDTGSLVTTASFNQYTSSNTSQFAGTSSYALTSSYATTAGNGGVTQLLAGTNIILSPTNGLGAVTVNATGGSSFNTATGSFGSFYDTGSVVATSATRIYSMSLSNTDLSNGVFVSSSNGDRTKVKFTNAGVYNIQFSAQFSNSDNSTQDAYVWIRKNGTDIEDSSGAVGVPPFKAGSNGQALASWNYYLSLSANDYVQMCWHVEQANVITLETIAAGTSPTHPRTPSLILTAQRVDTFLSNTGSFQGSFSGSFSGSLFGTASNATTASYVTGSIFTNNNLAASASYALTASFALNAGGATVDTGSLLTTASFNSYTGSSISQFAGTASFASTASFVKNVQTASYVLQAVSSSYALTASYLSGYVSPFPYTGSALITGSLGITGSLSNGSGNIVTGLNSHAEGNSTSAGTTKAYLADSILAGVITLSSSYGNATSSFSVGDYLVLDDRPEPGFFGKVESKIASVTYTAPNTVITVANNLINTEDSTAIVYNITKADSLSVGNITYGGNYSHAEGIQTRASGDYSHAEGFLTVATGDASHAEGYETKALGAYSHAEGQYTVASGLRSHAEGESTVTSGEYSHAEGNRTIASGDHQHVQGQYNITSSVAGAFIHGNGIDVNNRSNLIYAYGTGNNGVVEITGSLKVSGSITGSLLGTASQSVSSSYALTASYAMNAGGATVDTGSLLTTASFNSYTGSSTSQFAGTASFAQSSSNFVIANTLRLDNTLTDYKTSTSTTSETLNLFQQATGSYTSAFVKYSILNGINARAGEFVTVWNGTTVVNYDNSTTDIGDTAAVTFNSSIVSSQIQINAVVSAGWTVKALATFI